MGRTRWGSAASGGACAGAGGWGVAHAAQPTGCECVVDGMYARGCERYRVGGGCIYASWQMMMHGDTWYILPTLHTLNTYHLPHLLPIFHPTHTPTHPLFFSHTPYPPFFHTVLHKHPATHTFDIVQHYPHHRVLAYGADWKHDGRGLVATASFYEKSVHVWQPEAIGGGGGGAE